MVDVSYLTSEEQAHDMSLVTSFVNHTLPKLEMLYMLLAVQVAQK